ncbi:MAG: cell division protein ZapA [Prevotella sp.]|nr:cell division protein ZapA [Prevotella sp.]
MEDSSREKLRITLKLYDREFNVYTYPEDEELYRKAAKLITGLVNGYTDNFRGLKSESDILYMVMLELAFRYESEAHRNDVEPYRTLLSKLTQEIEGELGEG